MVKINIKEEQKKTVRTQHTLYVIQYLSKDNLNWMMDPMYESTFNKWAAKNDLRYAKSLKSNNKYRMREYKLQEVV